MESIWKISSPQFKKYNKPSRFLIVPIEKYKPEDFLELNQSIELAVQFGNVADKVRAVLNSNLVPSQIKNSLRNSLTKKDLSIEKLATSIIKESKKPQMCSALFKI